MVGMNSITKGGSNLPYDHTFHIFPNDVDCVWLLEKSVFLFHIHTTCDNHVLSLIDT